MEPRNNILGASDVACLMTGNAQAIYQLWLEKTAQAPPEDLTRAWPIQLGKATECLNLDWYEMKNGAVRRGGIVIHPVNKWAVCHPDGIDLRIPCPIECKHVGGREPIGEIIKRYQPQCQWQMYCCETRVCGLSVIMGANEPTVEYLDRDEAFIGEAVKRGSLFMEHVLLKTKPVDLPSVPAPPPVSKWRDYDMTGNNQWGDQADEWLQTVESAERNKDAEKLLKSLVPIDAGECKGHGVRITRDRAGRMSLRAI